MHLRLGKLAQIQSIHIITPTSKNAKTGKEIAQLRDIGKLNCVLES